MLGKILRYLVSIYGVSKGEAIGFIILIPALFIVISIPVWFKYVYRPDAELKEEYFHQFQEWVAESRASVKNDESATSKEEVDESIVYRTFDPNSSSVDELISLGFKPWIAERIVKYRNAGGSFKKAEDLKKIYGISEEHLKEILPYVDIQVTSDLSDKTENSRFSEDGAIRDKIENEEINIRNLNSAIPEELTIVRGIGPVLSERIVNYRDLLGGFVDMNQLQEVYGLKDRVLEELTKYFKVDSIEIRQLDVNYLRSEELRKHPYINYNLSNAIEQYRIQHGEYNSAHDLLEIKILDDSTFQKILPYIKIN